LKPQAAHRQTACIRYMSPPQRSQSILLSWDVVFSPAGTQREGTGRIGGRLGSEWDIAAIIRGRSLLRPRSP
jgi:hypothetical protein